jgi:rare lipoprotein A
MRARFGNRLPAVKLGAGLLVLVAVAALLQAFGVTSATADHASARVIVAKKKRDGCRPTAVSARADPGGERPEFIVRRHTALALAGHTVAIRGRLKDACAGAQVRLLQRRGHGWRALASVSIGRKGGFRLDYRTPEAGTAGLRVSFGGGHGLHPASRWVGAVTAMHPAVASWYYDDTGATGCGFQAKYGVANKTLPCGTKVTLAYGGRTVVATVDDRGPYVPGRTYDLGINTRNALGMNGVVTLLASS